MRQDQRLYDRPDHHDGLLNDSLLQVSLNLSCKSIPLDSYSMELDALNLD